jgi:polysaccharide export outer membrane protein
MNLMSSFRQFFRPVVGSFLLCFAVFPVLAQQSAPPVLAQEQQHVSGTSAIAPAPRPAKFLISAGDLIEVSVYGVPELSQKTRVNASGELYMPLVGYTHVEGLTIADAQAVIEKRLVDGGFVNSPHVSLFTSEYAQGVSVMGEVNKPGIYPLVGSHSVLDLISAAQGPTPAAGRSVTIVRRDDPKHGINVMLSSDPAKNNDGNVEVQQGDTIIVSKGAVVYVVGEVTRPSGFVIDPEQGLTVTKALAMALGPLQGASLDKTKIVRKTPAGLVEIPVALKKLMHSNGQDVALQAEDIVFIPGSGAGKGAAKRSLEAIVQISTGLAVYRP